MKINLSDLDPETRRKVLELIAGEEEPQLAKRKKRVLKPLFRLLAQGMAVLMLVAAAVGVYTLVKLGGAPYDQLIKSAANSAAQDLGQKQKQEQDKAQAQNQGQAQERPAPPQPQPHSQNQPQAAKQPQQAQAQQEPAPVTPSLSSAEPEAQAVGSLPPSPPFRAILTGKLARYPLSNAYRIPVLVGVESFSKPIGAKTWAELGINSVNGIIDTGAAQTCIPDWFLRQQGYRPVKGPFPISGIGKGPLNAYEYDIPPPYIWSNTDKTYVQITKSEMLVTVLGVQGYDEALIGADLLRYCSFYVAGNTWVLGVK